MPTDRSIGQKVWTKGHHGGAKNRASSAATAYGRIREWEAASSLSSRGRSRAAKAESAAAIPAEPMPQRQQPGPAPAGTAAAAVAAAAASPTVAGRPAALRNRTFGASKNIIVVMGDGWCLSVWMWWCASGVSVAIARPKSLPGSKDEQESRAASQALQSSLCAMAEKRRFMVLPVL